MKPIENFLSYLDDLDIKLWIDEVNGSAAQDVSLRCNAPKGTLTPDIRAELAERKDEIIAFLQKASLASTFAVEPIRPISRNGTIPLSLNQQRLWFLHQIEGESTTYNEFFAVSIKGLLQINHLEQSLQEIIQRHEVLRTTFPNQDGYPFQAIAPTLAITLPVVDLQALPKVEQSALIQQLSQEVQRPFDLVNGPLLRVTLVQLEKESYVLLLCMHHIVYDGWSMGVFIQELSTLYQAFCAGVSSPLAELPIQYADFVVWQRQWLSGEVLKTQLDYWLSQLHDAPSRLQLPTDHPRPSVQTYQGRTESFSLNTELTQKLQSLSRESGTTLFMTLLAAFATLLYRYSGESDILIGSPIANRNRSEIESLIGFFVNTLVLRTSFEDNPSFKNLLAQVRETTLKAYKHQDVTFEQIVEALQPQRSLAYSPLFQVMFVLQNTPMSELELPGCTWCELNQERTIARFDLTLTITETSQGLVGSWDYSTDLFDGSTIERMAAHFQNLLSAIVENPVTAVSELPLLSAAERHQLLRQWNDTATEYPTDKCIHQLFEQQVERTPDAVAVVFENQQLTYEQLNRKANQLAHHLQTLGVGPEVLVGICVERSLDMVVALLGILKAGGAYVPLDPTYPQERLSYMLADSGVEVLLTHRQLLSSLPSNTAQVVSLDNDWEAIEQYSHQNLDVGVDADNLAYVIYTSGSTGLPKGAMNTHQGIRNRLLWMQDAYQLTSSDRVLQKTPFSFDVSVWEFFWPLLTGARIVIAKPEGHKDSTYLVNLISTQQITTIHFVPSMLQVFLQEPNCGNCSCLQRVICSGEALPFELTERFFEHLECELHNLYGPTEAAIDVTFWQCQLQENRQLVPIGRPIANTQVYILDKQLQAVPIGVPGELYIGGDGLARGYLNRPELTSEKFIPNPFCDRKSERLYKTGDLARYSSDGNIEFLGRIDYQVKIRGFRIELGEIESVLNTHPQIQQTVIIAIEDIPDNKRLVAYIVSEDELLTTNQLREFLFSKLPEYMVPSAFVTLDTLPLTANGKVDRKALPAPEREISQEDEYVAPRTPSEEIIANIFASVLNIQAVGINDNFFTLGGHSLLATQLISRLRVAFEVEIELRAVFSSPTVAQLEQTLTQLRTSDRGLSLPPIQPRTQSEELPLSFAQERLWFLNQLEEASAIYNISGAVRISGNLDINALQQALSEIVRRHEILRTSFPTVNRTSIQVIHPQATMNIKVVDLQQLEVTERETVLQQQAQLEATTPFDLEIVPLIRCSLVQLDAREYVLLLNMHHIVSDGWSMGVFIQELSTLYQAYCAGVSSPLAELPIQYADFVVWQRQWLSGEVLKTQLDYWLSQLHDAPSRLQLPTDHPRPSVQTYQGRTESFSLNTELTQKLQSLSRESGTTLFMTLLAAFATLLYRYSGESDILIGSPIANRNRSEIESLIGCFVNTLVLRTSFEDNPSFKNLLAQVRETTLKAYEHQDVPFEQVVEALQPQRSLAYSPLFQVMFVLQNTPMGELELPGCTWCELNQESTIAKFDLTLTITETSQGLVGSWDYSTDLFDGSTIERMAAHFQNLLSAIVENPVTAVSELPLLSAAERHQLLRQWNDTATEYPTDKCIHQLFEQQVERTPDAVAVVFENQQLTYEQLNRKANQLAHHLQTLGVGPEVLVGICVERSLDMVVGQLGILKAGGTYVPLDPTYPFERLSFILEDVQSPVLLTQESLLDSLPSSWAQVICLDSDWETITHCSKENPISGVVPSHLAYVMYTSGSTGQPKGVTVRHSGVVRLVKQTNYVNLTEEEIFLQLAPFSFDAATFEIWGCLLNGARLVVMPPNIPSLMELGRSIRQYQVTTLWLTAGLFQQMVDQQIQDLKPVRQLLAGGDALSVAHVQKVSRQLENCQLINGYGPTENTTFTCCYLVTQAAKLGNTVPIGRAIANTQVYILDRNLQPVPVGVAGELYIGGDGLACGYLNRPELTAEKFLPNSFDCQPGARLYKTGDLGRYLASGDIEFLGRMDSQVKIRGFRIELGEIEAALGQHPEVRSTVVIVREDVPGDKRLVAYLVLYQEQTPTVSDLRQFLKQKLPEYMIPTAFVFLATLPLTPNSKVDRRALPVPEYHRELEVSFVAPRNPTEEMLAGIWAEVLGVERVGIHDNFFELGGHSLLATQVITRLSEAFSLELPLRSLFENSTIAQLAEVAVVQKIEQAESNMLEQMLDEFDELSDDEVKQLLTQHQ
ncbi:amino acid adenylation domain-containing protein [uncultured Nostoc sp.]|uniref:amino acid adenylation domain-containing protein n=1 Tax=uncultured Nostoc sp. TaxID=340711 RepID=UPI0035CB326A